MRLVNKIRSLYYRCYLKIAGAAVGKNLQLNGPVDILLRDGASLSNIKVGNNVTFSGKIYIRMRKNGCITIEDGVRAGNEVWLVAANEEVLFIGSKTILGSYSIFNGGHGLTIGSDCIFAAFVYINTSDHGIKKNELIQNQEFLGRPITIGEDVWLGGHVFINKGVTIHNGAIIGAGAVVTKDIPENSIAVGNPALVIKERE
jgi:acetyltransferase-like isoleucine patch superfamily enzyme